VCVEFGAPPLGSFPVPLGPPLACPRAPLRGSGRPFSVAVVFAMPFFSLVSPRPAAGSCAVALAAAPVAPVAAPVAPVAAPVAPASEAPCVAPAALVSLSGSLAWGGLVGRVVGFPSGGWDPARRRVLVSVLPRGASRPVVVRCSVFSAPPAEVSALVSSLRAARRSGELCSFAVRRGWEPRAWFAGVRLA